MMAEILDTGYSVEIVWWQDGHGNISHWEQESRTEGN
ncbi:MAG: hypothetical protein JWQ04_107 [Pedosphaera sp.]|nr:hypothetical protein [Pedosphaera sp.]